MKSRQLIELSKAKAQGGWLLTWEEVAGRCAGAPTSVDIWNKTSEGAQEPNHLNTAASINAQVTM